MADIVILQANTPAELRTGLAELDIDVPLRSEGRKSHHAERYCIAHLLATLPTSKFSFPLTLTHRDKPDFLLAMPGGEVGIEHTEAVPQNVAHAATLRERGAGPEVYFIPRAIPGERPRTAAELRREIEADEPGTGWYGDSPERQWAVAMVHYVKEKIPKVMADGFVRFPTNWLLVYDNWPVPAIDYAKAASYLAPLLTDMDAFLVFDAIFIHDDGKMAEFRDADAPLIHALAEPGRAR